MTMTDPTYEGSEKGIGWVCVVVSPIMFTAELNCHVCLKMIPQQVWQQYLTPFPPCLCLLTAGSIKVIFELYFPDWDWQVTAANRKGPCHTNHDISKNIVFKDESSNWNGKKARQNFNWWWWLTGWSGTKCPAVSARVVAALWPGGKCLNIKTNEGLLSPTTVTG